MAYIYSSWEYSQGPILYIDSSGFKSIDEDKNFEYYYIVKYSPVEYRRKVTDEQGVSFYEFKYSFGSDFTARKELGEYTFEGKSQVTKTVTHSVTEDGFQDSITKTFYIDTNMSSNLDTNIKVEIDPTLSVSMSDWKFNTTSSVTIPSMFNGVPCGWVTVTKTGYRTESYTSYGTSSSWSGTGAHVTDPPSTWSSGSYPGRSARLSIGYYDGAKKEYSTDNYTYWTYKGNSYRSENDGGNVYKKTYSSYSYTSYRTVSYTYKETYGSYGLLNLKTIRDKIHTYLEYSSVVLRFKSSVKLNNPPTVYMDSATTATAQRQTLSCKISGEVSAGQIIEYYVPMSLITSTFASVDSVYVLIDKGNCSASDAYFSEYYAYIETETDKIPYLNLVIEAFDILNNKWYQACTIPYLNYLEIKSLRESKQHISKNLFLPESLPKTDSSYRVRLDTNLIAKEAEMLVNFRLDVLAKQLISPGSVTDRKLYLNNDSEKYEAEVEVDVVDELKLNVLGSTYHEKKTHPGFLRKGANDIHAYLKNYTQVIDDSILSENRTKNKWYNSIESVNGNWISNSTFVANTIDVPQVTILQGADENLNKDIITFKIPYSGLQPNSTYNLMFGTHIQKSFTIANVNTVNASDEYKVVKSKVFTKTTYDPNKITVTELDKDYYTPLYKRQDGSSSELISEYDICGKDIDVVYTFKTKEVSNSDKDSFIIKIRSKAIKNMLFKNMQCVCINNKGEKSIDIIEPYNVDAFAGRQFETFMTIYYDGFNIENINPLLYDDMMYLKHSLNKIREDYTLSPYPWSKWFDESEDEVGHKMGVYKDNPIRATHFNEVKDCCIQTYSDLLALRPPVTLNTTPSLFRDNTDLILLDDKDDSKGYVLQHVKDREGKDMEIDKYFPEWRKIVELINRN